MINYGLRNSYYTSQLIFNRELKKIYTKLWIPISIREKDYRVPVNLFDKSLFLSNKKEYFNCCSHRKTKLVLNKEKYTPVLKCPYHNWCFKNGNIIKSPHTKLDSKNDLKEICIDNIGPLEFINFSPYLSKYNFISTPRKQFGKHYSKQNEEYEIQNFNIFSSGEFLVNANWKLILENFLDYLHVPSIHPELAQNSKINNHMYSDSEKYHIGFKIKPIEYSKSSPLSIINQRYPYLYSDILEFNVLFPNCFMFLHKTHMFVVFVLPLTTTTSLERYFILTHKDIEDNLLSPLEHFYLTTNNQDIEICERVQQGVSSGNDNLPILLDKDEYIVDYLELYQDLMN